MKFCWLWITNEYIYVKYMMIMVNDKFIYVVEKGYRRRIGFSGLYEGILLQDK